MSNELATVNQQTQEVALPQKKLLEFLDAFGIGDQLTNGEKTMFCEVAQALKLNPFKREIYPVAYGEGDKRKLNLITGYEVYIKRAERSGLLKGWRVWTTGSLQEKVIKATYTGRDHQRHSFDKTVLRGDLQGHIEIYRKDWPEPFVHEVDFDEFTQDNAMWQTKPRTMIKKVAIGQGFRLAFPDEFGGMPYVEEEIAQPETIEGEVIPPETPQQATRTATIVENLKAAQQAQPAPDHEPEPEPEPETEGPSPELRKIVEYINAAKSIDELNEVSSAAVELADEGEINAARQAYMAKVQREGWNNE